MIAKKMRPFLENNSAVRMMFEEGNRLKALYGEDKVFDFSLGNPNVPAPEEIRTAILDILDQEDPLKVHGYMSNAGFPEVRQALAEDLNERFGTSFSGRNLIMVVGAASGLNVVLKTLADPGDEVVVFAPYFLEYRNYVNNYDCRLVEIAPDTRSFQLNLEDLAARLSEKTKALILNNPNNPTGTIYGEETIRRLADLLRAKQEEYGHAIYLISDEPYRELAYDGVEVPFLTKYYENTIVVYSYSKSLSLPGERIGYVLIPDQVENSEETLTAATIANRILGSVNAPSLIQLAVARSTKAKVNLAFYDRNRKTLYEGLTRLGFSCVRPEGAFYLWLKSPLEDDRAFVEAAKKYNILMVAGSSFAGPGYVRLAYCVSYETVVNSLAAFEKLAQELGLKKEGC